MKNTLKKVMASVMAVASLAVSITGMSANAYWADRTFSDNSDYIVTGYLSVSTSELYAYTSSGRNSYKTVNIYNFDNAGTNVGNALTTKKVSKTKTGGSYTNATSSHSSAGYYMSPALTVWA